MRRGSILAAHIVAGLCFGGIWSNAQSALLNLPDLSQAAQVAQRIGLTDITIVYHRPLVRGRTIFGGLQPYGEVWRAGANVNTTISFSDPVTIDGSPLPKGTYGLHMIPGETSWIIIFSKNSTSWGSFTYDQAEDALRVTVKPQITENHEALSYEFDDLKPNSTVITMRWEKIAVPFKVEVNTPDIVAQSLRKQLRGRVQFEWQSWEEAANYLLDNELSVDEAVTDVDRSLEIEDRFENEMTKARALQATGQNGAAIDSRKKALALGSQLQIHDFARRLQRQGRFDEAIDLFHSNIAKDPKSWVAHNEAARIAVAGGDFDAAIKEMKLAVDAATGSLKAQNASLVTLLQNKVDINK